MTTHTVYGSIPNKGFTPTCCDTPTLATDQRRVGANGLAYVAIGCSVCAVDWIIVTETVQNGRSTDA